MGNDFQNKILYQARLNSVREAIRESSLQYSKSFRN